MKSIAGMMNSDLFRTGEIPAAESIAKNLGLAMKSYDLTKSYASVLNSDFLSTGASSAMESLTKTLESAVKSYESATMFAGVLNDNLLGLKSLTKTLEFATSYEPATMFAGVLNDDLLGMKSITKNLDFAMKSYEPIMNSIASRIDMSALLTEVSRNFSLSHFESFTDLNAFSRSLVSDLYVSDLLSDLDLDSFAISIEEEFGQVNSHLVDQDETREQDAVAVAAEIGIYLLALLIFVHFVLPGIATICIMTAKELIDVGVAALHLANDISKVPVVGGVLTISGGVKLAVGTRNAVKNRSKMKDREEYSDDETSDH